jgi:hypothetical protein
MKTILSLALCLLFSVVFAQGSGFRSEGRDAIQLPDLQTLAAGTYIAVISIGDEVETYRLILE